MTTLLHLRSDLFLVNWEDSRMVQILSGVVQRAVHFIWIVSNEMYVRFPLEVVCDFGDQQSFKASCFFERIYVHQDSWSDRWWWNITTLVYEVLNGTSQLLLHVVVCARFEERLVANLWLSRVLALRPYIAIDVCKWFENIVRQIIYVDKIVRSVEWSLGEVCVDYTLIKRVRNDFMIDNTLSVIH